MQKQYHDIGTLIKEFGFIEAISYKFLEFRDKHPLANRLFPELIIGHINSAAYARSYNASWDARGRLAYFDPNPDPKDFRPIDLETHQTARRLTEAERQERLPVEFGFNLSKILEYNYSCVN